MVHGSGPSVVGADNLEAWHKQTGKPFGIFWTIIQTIGQQLKSLLLKASFIFTRETASIKALEKAGITGNHILFAPDATYYLNIRDDRRADAFLKGKGLDPGKFICVIPRLRYTPYHKIRKIDWNEQKIKQVEETKEKYKESDHAKLREAMIAWVRKTGNVYAKAFAVLRFECHFPIIALANSIPAFTFASLKTTSKDKCIMIWAQPIGFSKLNKPPENRLHIR